MLLANQNNPTGNDGSLNWNEEIIMSIESHSKHIHLLTEISHKKINKLGLTTSHTSFIMSSINVSP